MFKIAIVGCANVGKTTLFNLLTGKKNKVGNWEGVTVDITYSNMLFNNDVQVYDLPGISSFNIQPKSHDQIITRDFLFQNKVDLIVNVINIDTIKRDLQLTLELYESGIPILIVITNHHKKTKHEFKLSFLDCDIIDMNLQQKGIIREIIEKIKSKCLNKTPIVLESHSKKMNYDITLMNNEAFALSNAMISLATTDVDKYFKIQKLRNAFIDNAIQDIPIHSESPNKSKLDIILMHKLFAIPIFFTIICCILFITVFLGNILKPIFENTSQTFIIQPIVHAMKVLTIPQIIMNIFEFGIGSAIQTIASFIPLLFILYILLGIIDESGYMTRASTIMGKIAAKIGLCGRSMIPLIVGFGCNVPAIMGTRIIHNHKQRILTIILIPFMSCSARLTVFTLFTAAFFSENSTIVICSLYFFSIFIASVFAFIVQPYFVDKHHRLEDQTLPKYRIPSLNRIFKHTVNKIQLFIVEAGKTIIVISTIIYFLSSNYSNFQNKESLLITFSKNFSFIFEPIGIEKDNWPASVSLLTGVIAKEVITSTLNTLYNMQNASQTHISIQKNFKNSINAFAYILFVLLYFPCIAVFSVIQKEAGLTIAIITSIFYTVLGYVISAAFYMISQHTHSIVESLIILSIFLVIIGVVGRLITKIHCSLKNSF